MLGHEFHSVSAVGEIRSELGSRDDAVVRELAFHHCGLGSNPAWCHMWVEFIGSSLLRGFFHNLVPGKSPWERGWIFHRVRRFSSLHKNPTSPNFHSTRIVDLRMKTGKG